VIKVSLGADGTHKLLAVGQSNMTNSVPVVIASDNVLSASGVTIASMTTGTVNVVNTVAISGSVTALSVVTGTMDVVNVLSASNVTVATIATGTVSVVNTPTVTVSGDAFYAPNSTNLGTTGDAIVVAGIQGTTARALAMDAAGNPQVDVLNVTTGTVDVANTVAISGSVTALSLTTGTVNVVNVLSASGVTIASVTTGTMNVVNVLSATGVLLAATTANVGAFVGTAHASRFDAYAVNTTSGSSTIVQTSGAHTLYITDMILSCDVPSRVDIFSAATTKMSVYMATKGGFTVSLKSPMVLNSNQSLTFTPSASGSASLFAAGYTVT
jgi:hypothetical protein